MAWFLAGLIGWALIDSLSSRVLTPFRSLPLVAGYAIWIVFTAAIAFAFVYVLRRIGAPSAVWLGVLGWSLVRLIAVVIAWLVIPAVRASPSADIATAASVVRSLAAIGSAYYASRVGPDVPD